jgi:predicted secreted hydrolase
MKRRVLLQATAATAIASSWPRTSSAQVPSVATAFATVTPLAGRELTFPRDHGAHPAFRTEWWYLTGLVTAKTGETFGFQCTFFRNGTGVEQSAKHQSAFMPSQLVMAHFAVTRVSDTTAKERLTHIQRIGRATHGLAGASETTTDVFTRNWRLQLKSDGYHITAKDSQLSMALIAQPTQAILLQGDRGFSRKGPNANQASYYYSQPQLRVSGGIELDGKRFEVQGTGWLDHEWSTEVMSSDATGWDWVGMNLADGSALMAFRMRQSNGSALYTAATYRSADQRTRLVLSSDQVQWEDSASWPSEKSGARYPSKLTLSLNHPQLRRQFELVPMAMEQEIDAKATTGTVYWEGVTALVENGQRVGAGYLEMTGYWKPIRF